MALRRTLLALCTAALAAAGPALGMGDPGVAALQVALRAKGVYHGTIDGVRGTATTAAVIAFQQRARLVPDGVVGPRTRAALGRRGRPPLGSRDMGYGTVGWDVAALQFLLAWHGFPSGRIDGRFGGRLDTALRGFQAWAGIAVDGVAGRQTLAALRRPLPRSPLALAWPLALPVGDRFGPRGARFHAGIDIPAVQGTPVAAARAGWVVFAGQGGSFGRLVVVSHGRGVETWYAHLSQVGVHEGRRVRGGARIGLAGSSGESTGPHLHFEVRVRGAAVDPLPALATR
jgi:murein DD-endopeptidase MepM/ murein hydrolase activator NlpD